jgi:hypothetical protein
MTKEDAIRMTLKLEVPNINTLLAEFNQCRQNPTNITQEQLILLLSKPKYNLRELGLPTTKTLRLTNLLFPERPSGLKPCKWLLVKYGYKYCHNCNTVHSVNKFNKNSNKDKKDGYNGYCKDCQYATTKTTQTARSSNYRCKKMQKTPLWADLNAITTFYKNCPVGYHVDHIVPLNGTNVSGLHVVENLQYLPAAENIAKSNKFEIE